MPAILRQTAPEFTRKDGTRIKPKAIIAFCEVCNFEGAPYGSLSPDGKRLWWCAWKGGNPYCGGKGNGKPTGTNKQGSDNGDGVSDRAAGESADLFG